MATDDDLRRAGLRRALRRGPCRRGARSGWLRVPGPVGWTVEPGGAGALSRLRCGQGYQSALASEPSERVAVHHDPAQPDKSVHAKYPQAADRMYRRRSGLYQRFSPRRRSSGRQLVREISQSVVDSTTSANELMFLKISVEILQAGVFLRKVASRKFFTGSSRVRRINVR